MVLRNDSLQFTVYLGNCGCSIIVCNSIHVMSVKNICWLTVAGDVKLIKEFFNNPLLLIEIIYNSIFDGFSNMIAALCICCRWSSAALRLRSGLFISLYWGSFKMIGHGISERYNQYNTDLTDKCNIRFVYK